jgi:hypothetical protein
LADQLERKKRMLADELDAEKYGKLFGTRFVWKSPSEIDDYLLKEKLKRQIKEELIDEKQRAKKERELAKLWSAKTTTRTATAKKSPARKPAAKKSPTRKPAAKSAKKAPAKRASKK